MFIKDEKEKKKILMIIDYIEKEKRKLEIGSQKSKIGNRKLEEGIKNSKSVKKYMTGITV